MTVENQPPDADVATSVYQDKDGNLFQMSAADAEAAGYTAVEGGQAQQQQQQPQPSGGAGEQGKSQQQQASQQKAQQSAPENKSGGSNTSGRQV